jgi:diaminohydroxyphosphoribosylaminopyrimidine deaminase/5-amino-6-(5-phosphoribosylamino)uracil reductase
MPARPSPPQDVDAAFMALALAAARRGHGRTAPNPQVGCVVVQQGAVVGIGHHVRAGTAHAEVVALTRAGARANGADLYVTLEPCHHTGRTGPCTAAILAAGIKRVIVGARDPDPRVDGRGLRALRRAPGALHGYQ